MLVFTQPSFDHGSACFLCNSLINHSEFLLILSWHQVKTGNQNSTLSHSWWWWLLSWQVVQAIKVSDSQSQNTTSLSYRLFYDRRWSPKLGRLTNLFSIQLKTCTHNPLLHWALYLLFMYMYFLDGIIRLYYSLEQHEEVMIFRDTFLCITGHPN